KIRRIASSTIGLVERRIGEQSRPAASGQLLPIRDLTIARYLQGSSPGQTGTTFGASALSVWLAHCQNNRVGAIQQDLALLLRHPSYPLKPAPICKNFPRFRVHHQSKTAQLEVNHVEPYKIRGNCRSCRWPSNSGN